MMIGGTSGETISIWRYCSRGRLAVSADDDDARQIGIYFILGYNRWQRDRHN